ncbi:MAG: hypothetical protein ACE5D0_07465 [Fidelibacterota bacterium]
MKLNWKHPLIISTLILIGIICLLFYHVIFQGQIFGSPDTMNPKSASLALSKVYEDTGEFPLWQPWIFSGMPTAEAFTFLSQLYFPSIIINLLFIKGLFAQLLHLLFAGFGGFILLRSLKLSQFASFLGGAVFMMTPFMITMIVFGHGSQMMTAAYIPWIMWMTIKIMKKPSFCNVGILALLFGLQLQRAHAQIAYYTWMLAGAYVLYITIINLKNPEKQRKTVIGFGSFAGAVIIGIGIALLIYLPSMEYTPFSVRGANVSGGADYNYATSWSLHPKEILTFLLPSAFGFGGQTYWGFMPFTDYPNYMGIIIILLAAYGLFTKRTQLSWFLLGTSILALLISFGKHFSLIYDLFFNIFPYFNKFRVPAMILILVQFNMAVLAAMGLGALGELKEKVVPRWFWIASGILGLWLLMLILGSSILESSLLRSFTSPRTQDPNFVRAINNLRLEIWNKDAWLLLLWTGIGLGAMWMRINRKITKNFFLSTLTIVALLDIGIVDWRIIHPSPRSGRSASTISTKSVDRYFKPDPVINYLNKQGNDFRIYPVGKLFGESRFRAFGLESVGGYHPAKLKITNEFIQKTRNIGSFPLMTMLNVHYLISSQPIPFPTVEEVFQGRMRSGSGVISATVYEMKNKLPRAWFVETVESKKDDQLWRMINEATFDPANTAYVNTTNNDVSGKYSKGIVHRIDRSIHEMVLEVSCEEDGFLVISEIYYPLRWKCTIDGQSVETIETNKLIRGVKIQAGEHLVKFVYDKSSFKKGIIISFTSFLIALSLVGFGYYRNHDRE